MLATLAAIDLSGHGHLIQPLPSASENVFLLASRSDADVRVAASRAGRPTSPEPSETVRAGRPG